MTAEPRSEVTIDPELLAILVCPMTRTTLRLDAERGELVSDEGGLAYPIRDGVPVLLLEEARRTEHASDEAVWPATNR